MRNLTNFSVGRQRAGAISSSDVSWASGAVAQPADVGPRQAFPGSITAEAKSLHRMLLLHGSMPADELSLRMRIPVEQAWSCLEELAELGLITTVDGAVTAIPYARAVESLLAAQSRLLEQSLETIRRLLLRLNVLMREDAALSGDGVGTVLAASPGGDPDRVFHAAQTRPVAGVAALHPGTRFSENLLATSLKRAAAQLSEGLNLRVIHQSAALSHPQSAEYFREIERMGGQVRFSDILPFRLMLIDGKTAVCRLPDPGGAPETLLFQGARMLGLLGELFETAWIQAAPMTEISPQQKSAALESAPPPLNSQQQTILRYLADGATDQAIARQLGTTTRTVARRINEIYLMLGVHSRFQAGAMARRRGLI